MTKPALTRSQQTRSSGDPIMAARLIGMVHLPPLPGSPRASESMSAIIRRAVDEARLLTSAGFDGLMVENFGDAPFAAGCVPPETIAAMAIVVDHVVRAVKAPVGVNVLRNDALAALAVAATARAAFIRVNVLSGAYATDQGIITGAAHELLRRRAALAPWVRIAADVHVKHAVPISQPDIALAAEETTRRGGADALIVSGPATGWPVDFAELRRVREAVPECPLWIGSGATPETLGELLSIADAAIIGTSLKRGGVTTAPLDSRKVRAAAAAGRRLHK